jgi:hypothetical protein
MSWDSSVSKWMVVGWTVWVQLLAGKGFFSSPLHPDWLWSSAASCLLGILSAWDNVTRVKLTTHLHLVLRSRMYGALLSCPLHVFMVLC